MQLHGVRPDTNDRLPTAKTLANQPKKLLEILAAIRSGMSFSSIEAKFSLRPANGMTAWRACKLAAPLEGTNHQKLDSEISYDLAACFPELNLPAGDLPKSVLLLRKWSLKTKTNIFDKLASQPPPSPPNPQHFNAQMDRLAEEYGNDYRWAAEAAKWRYGLTESQWNELCGINDLSMERNDYQKTLGELEHRVDQGLLLEEMYKYLAIKKLGILSGEKDENKLYDEWRKVQAQVMHWCFAGARKIWLPIGMSGLLKRLNREASYTLFVYVSVIKSRKNPPYGGFVFIGDIGCKAFMRTKGVEPLHLAVPDPKSGASASSATSAFEARLKRFDTEIDGDQLLCR